MNRTRTVSPGQVFDYDVEPYAEAKYPQKGTCPKSCFKSGWHRVGIIPVASVVDNGVPGVVCVEVCLECGQVLTGSGFIIRQQPISLKTSEVACLVKQRQ